MSAEDPTLPCAVCGTPVARSEMFGVEPDLLCARCASGVRRRLHVRARPHRPDRPPVATAVCLGVAVLLFVGQQIAEGSMRQRQAPPAWLVALHQGPEIWLGEVWRHLTCMFLHGGWLHLALNGYALWFLGRHVEAGWGAFAMLGVLLGTGVAGSALEWTMNGGGVGLSGGILGLCGFLWALRRVHPIAAAVMHEQQVRWILTLLVVSVVLSVTGALPIGNWAHGGGLVTGVVIGLAVRHRRRAWLVPASALLVVALVLVSVRVAVGSVVLVRGEDGPTETWSRDAWRSYWLEREE